MELNDKVKAELTPTGKLRAAINLSNFLLVTGKADNGDPVGVSPDMAAEVARRLGVPLELVPYPNPGALGDDADSGNWDIGNIGAEPQR
ncbi:MAG: transporter substrate-binding domain-containing protein, partial [Geminicoccaceae bacterium]